MDAALAENRDISRRMESFLKLGPILPVLTIEKLGTVLSTVESLVEKGINIIEITLRTKVAIEAIEMVSREFPDLVVGGGTVLSAIQFKELDQAGARFAVSPGITSQLLEAARGSGSLPQAYRAARVLPCSCPACGSGTRPGASARRLRLMTGCIPAGRHR